MLTSDITILEAVQSLIFESTVQPRLCSPQGSVNLLPPCWSLSFSSVFSSGLSWGWPCLAGGAGLGDLIIPDLHRRCPFSLSHALFPLSKPVKITPGIPGRSQGQHVSLISAYRSYTLANCILGGDRNSADVNAKRVLFFFKFGSCLNPNLLPKVIRLYGGYLPCQLVSHSFSSVRLYESWKLPPSKG